MESFGDGSGTAVLGGGTVLVPELVHGRTHPQRVLTLPAELSGLAREGGKVTIGAGTQVSELEAADEPLATAARRLADLEIRAQATLGGNLCVRSTETPRGDLQAPLVVLGATVRTAGAGGERSEPLEEFLAAGGEGRLVLDVSYDDDDARQTGYAAVRRPHTHHYTILAVAAARRDGETRVAVTGAAPTAVRLPSVEAGGSPAEALNDVDPHDDALASGWYRRRVLPGLVEQALSSLA